MAKTKADKNSSDKKEFGTIQKVLSVIKPCEDIERLRAIDRAKIDRLMNGQPPYSPDEAAKNQIEVNVNWGLGKKIMRDANNQVNSALLHQGIMFNCFPEQGQIDKRDEWSMAFTKNIHKPLQRGQSGIRHNYLIKNRNASLTLHGPGALLWVNPFRWMPKFVPLEDLLIPTETYCDFSNLRYFAVNMYLTVGELIDMTRGDSVVPGWNKPMVDSILKNQKSAPPEGFSSTWRDQPEAMEQVFKENRGWYYSDATPKIKCRWFFYQEVDKPKQWYRLLLLREAYGEIRPDEGFLFDGSDTPFADNISQILNVQYGDNNFVPPLKHHAVRGLGVDLYAPIEELNRLFCEFIWATHLDFRMLFRIKDPNDRDRLKQIVLSQFSVLPEGLDIVKREERHQISPELFDQAANVMRDTLQESSSSFIKDTSASESGNRTTATEATIKSNQANTLVSSMLQSLYLQEGFYYEEVVRRFCRKDSADPEVKQFREDCLKDGIPIELLDNYKIWRVVPERVLGGGDKTQAQQEAAWLWNNQDRFDPAVLPKLKRKAVGTILNNYDTAIEFVPQSKVEATDGVMAAENVFGTLMQGQQCVMRKGIDQQGYIEILLKMMGAIVQRILSTDGMGTMEELIGLTAVAQNITEHIQVLSADKSKNQLVKQYNDALSQLTNEMSGFMQRITERKQAEQESQNDPQGQAKVQTTLLLGKTKADIAQATAAQKLQHKAVEFQLQQQHKAIETAQDIHLTDVITKADLTHEEQKHVLDMINQMRSAEIKNHIALTTPKKSVDKKSET